MRHRLGQYAAAGLSRHRAGALGRATVVTRPCADRRAQRLVQLLDIAEKNEGQRLILVGHDHARRHRGLPQLRADRLGGIAPRKARRHDHRRDGCDPVPELVARRLAGEHRSHGAAVGAARDEDAIAIEAQLLGHDAQQLVDELQVADAFAPDLALAPRPRREGPGVRLRHDEAGRHAFPAHQVARVVVLTGSGRVVGVGAMQVDDERQRLARGVGVMCWHVHVEGSFDDPAEHPGLRDGPEGFGVLAFRQTRPVSRASRRRLRRCARVWCSDGQRGDCGERDNGGAQIAHRKSLLGDGGWCDDGYGRTMGRVGRPTLREISDGAGGGGRARQERRLRRLAKALGAGRADGRLGRRRGRLARLAARGAWAGRGVARRCNGRALRGRCVVARRAGGTRTQGRAGFREAGHGGEYGGRVEGRQRGRCSRQTPVNQLTLRCATRVKHHRRGDRPQR